MLNIRTISSIAVAARDASLFGSSDAYMNVLALSTSSSSQ